jgi:cell wall-associated NlpC family hydrolase
MLLGVMLVTIVTASAAEIAYGAATVDASSLNIRSGPSTEYEPVTAVIDGTRMVILDTGDGKWYHVNYQGNVGYVDSAYLKEILTAENFKATGTLTANDVNMRAKPSTSSSIICSVSSETQVQVIGINNGWYKVIYNGKTGYIRSDFMEITGAPSGSSYTENSAGQQIANLALSFLGYRYVYGASSPSQGFDCSGLVYYVSRQLGYDVSRTASQQYKNNGVKVSKSELQPGDLVFFSSNGTSVTHVGIYIGNDQFVHASTSTTGVIISDLTSAYYVNAWWGAKRLAS